MLCQFGPVWLLSVPQRWLARPLPHGAAPAPALRPVGRPAEAKAPSVAVGGVTASYALRWPAGTASAVSTAS